MPTNSKKRAPKRKSAAKTKVSGTAPRVRRTAEEARERILDAAEARLRDGGPEAIRLQEIAADLGISHPTILHHFESRVGLTRALGLRISRRLVDELVPALTSNPTTEASGIEIIENVFATMGDTGTARLLAWRALSFDEPPEAASEPRSLIETVTKFLHERRVKNAREKGGAPPSLEDSTFLVRLALAAALGDALSHDVWAAESQPEDANDHEFRQWFARLLLRHFENG